MKTNEIIERHSNAQSQVKNTAKLATLKRFIFAKSDLKKYLNWDELIMTGYDSID